MDPREEQCSLVESPLPPQPLIRVPEDDTLPTRILDLDRQYEDLQNAAALNREARQALLDRALALKVWKDESTGVYIHKKEKNLPRRVNVDLLKEKYPEIHTKAVEIERAVVMEKAQALIDKIDEAGKDIRIKTLDALMDEAQIDQVCYPHVISVSWEVKKMRTGPVLPKGEKA